LASALAAAETENRQLSEAISKYMKENFGHAGMETSWYSNIVSITVQGRTVAVSTKISRQGKVKKEAAMGICGAVSGYVFSNGNRDLGIEHIQILGIDRGVVVRRRGLTDRCEAR
jgi:hypothetical protein